MVETGGDGVLGVENAPVDVFCSSSNSSCSAAGRRGGEGPVAKAAGRNEVVLKDRGVCAAKRRRARSRDIFGVWFRIGLEGLGVLDGGDCDVARGECEVE